MYSQLLDQKTYAAVVNAAPSVAPSDNAEIAQAILTVLWQESNKDQREGGYWAISLKDLAEMTGKSYTSARMGRVCQEMGLVKSRRRDGYHVYWNLNQLRILGSVLPKQGE